MRLKDLTLGGLLEIRQLDLHIDERQSLGPAGHLVDGDAPVCGDRTKNLVDKEPRHASPVLVDHHVMRRELELLDRVEYETEDGCQYQRRHDPYDVGGTVA